MSFILFNFSFRTNNNNSLIFIRISIQDKLQIKNLFF